LGSRAGGLNVRHCGRALLLFLALTPALGAAAQEVPPPAGAAPDTLPPTLAADTLPLADRTSLDLTDWLRPASAGFDLAVWDFDRAALGRFQGLSLFDLLVLLPGVELVRGGGFGRPTAMHALGGGGGRLRVFRDGIEIDPLESASLDLQRIGLAELEALRVERSLTGIRLELHTRRLADQRPFSQIEAATGDYQTRFLRAAFARPLGSRDVILAHFEVTDTDGFGGNRPFALNALGARWTRTLLAGLDAELHLRRTGYERAGEPAEGGSFDELQLRLRGAPAQRFAWEAYYASTRREPLASDPFPEPLRTRQLGARAAVAATFGTAEAALRTRPRQEGFHLPATDLELRAELLPHARLRALTELRLADGLPEGELGLSALLPGGFSLFGAVAGGRRAVGLLGDSTAQVVQVVDGDTLVVDTVFHTFPWKESASRGSRVGAGWSLGGWSVQGAALRLAPGLSAPFGVAFDRGADSEEVGEAAGFEVRAQIPLPLRGSWLQGDWTGWADTGGRAHLPEDSWRLALHFHRLFYEGNLEPTLRVEAVRRGTARVPLRGGGEGASLPTVYYNAYLQIRVLDVRAFVQWDNIFHDLRGADLPGQPLPGQRAVYGVRWHFFD
jgi:hypothetical protein